MCDLCFHSPCVSNCPNFEPQAVCYCDICGESIFNGDVFYEIADMKICEECVDNSKSYAEYEEYEPDGCDLYKARIEREMCGDY